MEDLRARGKKQAVPPKRLPKSSMNQESSIQIFLLKLTKELLTHIQNVLKIFQSAQERIEE